MTYPNTQLFINGQWCDAESGRTLPVFNPATGTEIGRLAHAGVADLERAAQAAQKGLFVQVGSFSNSENAAKTLAKMNKFHKGHVETVTGDKTIYRVLKTYGIPTQKEVVMGEGAKVLELLKEYGVSVSRLRFLLRQDKQNRPVLPILTTAQMLLPLDTGEKQE